MRIIHVSYHYDLSIKNEEDLLEKHYTVTGWAEALHKNGADVTVMNRFGKDASLDIKRKTQELQKMQTVKACSLADPSCESCQ